MKFAATIAVLTSAVVLLSACREVPHGSVMADTDASQWLKTDTVSVVYHNSDTTSLRNIAFVARASVLVDGERGRTLPLEVICTSPDGNSATLHRDFEFDGGRRRASLLEIDVPMIEDAVLGKEGDYVFEFVPTADVKDVWAVGIEISYGKR